MDKDINQNFICFRSRFNDALEILSSALLQSVQTKIKDGYLEEHQIALPLAHQIRAETSRFLFKLLFLFSAEAKGQIQVQNDYNDEGDINIYYSAYFLRKTAADMCKHELNNQLHQSTFLWNAVWKLFRDCEKGIQTDFIKIPCFGKQLFHDSLMPLMKNATITDDVLSRVIDRISRVPVKEGTVEYCDFKTLQVNHLGQIYEWLLEFEPKILEKDVVVVKCKKKDEPFYLTEKERETLNIAFKKDKCWVEESVSGPIFKMNPKSTVRSQTGTHFTPSQLGRRLALEAMDDILRPLEEKGDPEAILSLSILEPCLGSAGILAEAIELAAISVVIASQKNQSDRKAFLKKQSEIYKNELAYAKHRVVERMVYAVDKRIDAVELGKAALWQECATRKYPLPFLNHKIRTGDSIVGTWFLERSNQIPRWIHPGIKPLELLKSKDLRSKFPELDESKIRELRAKWSVDFTGNVDSLLKSAVNALELIEKERRKFLVETFSTKDLHKQEKAHLKLLDWGEVSTDAISLCQKKDADFVKSVERLPVFRKMRLLGDLATSLYFWPFDQYDKYPTPKVYYGLVEKLLATGKMPSLSKTEVAVLKIVFKIAYEKAFFHWEVEYPELFLNGNKPDICISNPPWDDPNVQEGTFWKQYHPLAGTKDFGNEKVKELVEKAFAKPPEWRCQFLADRQFSHFLKESGDYKALSGTLDLYRPFVENLSRLSRKRACLLLPQSLWINEGSKEIREIGMDKLGWDRLIGFINHGKRFFSSVCAGYSFAICRFSPGKESKELRAIFRLRSMGELEAIEEGKVLYLDNPEKREFFNFNWDTVKSLADDLALPEVRTAKDAEILGVLVNTGVTAKTWFENEKKNRDFDPSQDLGKSIVDRKKAKEGDIPLWRGGHFHIWKPYFQEEDESLGFIKGETHYVLPSGTPTNPKIPYTSLVATKDGLKKLPNIPDENGKLVPVYHYWRLALRHVASSTNARTLIVSLIPPGVVCSDSAYVSSTGSDMKEILKRVAIMGSLVADSFVRFYTAVSINIPQLVKLPVPNYEDRTALLLRTCAFVAALHTQVVKEHGRDEMIKAGKSISSKDFEEALKLLEKDRGEVANHVNALVAIAYTLSTNGAFKREHLKYLMDTHFPAVFSKEHCVKTDSRSGIPDKLNSDAILFWYDSYLKQYS